MFHLSPVELFTYTLSAKSHMFSLDKCIIINWFFLGGRKILSSDQCVISAFFELRAAYALCQFLMQLLCCITCSVISGPLG